MAEWIWFPGEYEMFHSIQLHGRRQEFGADYPCFWLLPAVYPNIELHKTVNCKKDGEFTFYANGCGYVIVDGVRYPEKTAVRYSAGKHDIKLLVLNQRGLPAAYVQGEEVFSDGSWTAAYPYTAERFPVGHSAAYTRADDNVEVFPFEYERRLPVSVEKRRNGTLYDFGRETFGKLVLEGVSAPVDVIYGESEEEATDPRCAVLRELGVDSDRELVSRAFRYIFVTGEAQPESVYMLYEYVPLEMRADFECDDPLVKQIFDLSAYTFHLNSREFFLDGIKRDRWVWSGDAYQSYMVNRYLFADDDITKRTVTALVGKPPYVQHINAINDYSFYQMIGVWEYWFASGDLDFVKFIYPRLYELYKFCVSRLDENGFVVYMPGDWIFIDWADLDKQGPMCAEQILLWRATVCMKELAAICGAGCECAVDTDELRKKIYEKYYRPDRGGFVDGYESGKELMNRQQNVFAVLYGLVTEEEAERIYECVLSNPEIPPIKTPYFELYELMAICKLGHVESVQHMLTEYWGGMLRLGATSVWEQFDPTVSGAEHYEMYGKAYGKSLCHAWGAGPILVLGRYIAGVEATDVGYSSFKVSPKPGVYKSFRARVPLRNGAEVRIEYTGDEFLVCATADGGSFEYGGDTVKLEKDKEYRIRA
ncbi:MAG: hypothetical protein IKB34_04475 [Clostridia bacterium]|nr:hypothetical protein [Clostridia bacterium]